MNAEQRIRLQLGELVVQIAVLAADNEAKDARIKELEASLSQGAVDSETPK